MLVAGLLVAMRVGACPQGYSRVSIDAGTSAAIGNLTIYAEDNHAEVCVDGNEIYAGPEHCVVSDAYVCCGVFGTAVAFAETFSMCVDVSRDRCASQPHFEWCDITPAEPADEGISEAIITVIVFVSLVAVAGAAGVYAAMGT